MLKGIKLLMVSVVLLGSLSPLWAGAGLVPVSEHVFSYINDKDASPANSFGANAGIIIGEQGVAVVDTLIAASQATRFIEDIRAVTDKPILYAINTHSHLDHSFGNSVFKEAGAAIIAHQACNAEMRQNSAATLAKAADFGLTPAAMAGTRISLADITFTDHLRIDLGNVQLELRRPSHSHSKGSIVVSVPTDRLVFAGDILFTNFHPYLVDSDLAGWQQGLDFLIELKPEKIIPGHGPISTLTDVKDLKDYLAIFDAAAAKLAAGNPEAEAAAVFLKKALPERTMGEWMIKANLQALYLNR